MTENLGFRQALHGVRVSEAVGDTVVDGRRLWIISDRASIRYSDRAFEEARTLDTLVTVERSVAGIVRGRHLYDRSTGLFRARHDTTVLAGEAVLSYPDGRVFRTPARYECFGSWALRDTAAQRQRLADIHAAEESTETGMLVLPVTPNARAVERDDPGVRDSLLTVWERTQDPDEYARLFGELWWGGDELQGLIRERRIAAGDTVYMFELLSEEAQGYGRQLDAAEARTLLPFFEDPGLVFAFGLERDALYEAVPYGVLYHPPVAVRDSSEWPCTPEACHLLADQWFRATEPRLRDVGLAVFFGMDPARWADTLLARVPPGQNLLGHLRGVAAKTLPAVGADWRDWRKRALSETCLKPSSCRTSVSFGQEGARALRFDRARASRDLASEFTARFTAEHSDSARLVFGVLRLAFVEDELNADSIVARLRSPSQVLRALGREELEHFFERRSTAADSGIVTDILDHYIASTYTAAPQWQHLDDLIAGRAPSMGPDPARLKPRTYFSSDGLPDELRRKWSGRVPFMSRAEWESLSRREARSVTFVAVERSAGPFARVTVTTTSFLERSDDESPHAYASGYSVFVVKLGDAWVIVGSDGSWIS